MIKGMKFQLPYLEQRVKFLPKLPNSNRTRTRIQIHNEDQPVMNLDRLFELNVRLTS